MSGVLYYQEKKRKRFSTHVIWTLASLRFFAFTLLALLLLRPITQWENHVIEKPIIVALFDNSASISAQKDGLLNAQLKEKLQQLDDKAEVVFYAFDQELIPSWDSLKFNGASTDLSKSLEQISTRYAGRNLSSIVLATDGIFNQGIQPLYVAQNMQVPFYNIGLGDTSIYRDIAIRDVEANRTTFLGNSFPVQIHLEGTLVKGEKTQIVIEHKGQVVAQKEISFADQQSYLTENFEFISKEKGTQRYTVKVNPVGKEKSTTNNRLDFYIQVLDERQKVLLLAGSPHPDIAAIRSAFEESDSHSIVYELATDWKGKLSDYGMVIFHGMPQNATQLNLMKQFQEKNIPSLHITTHLSQWNLLNTLKLGMGIQGTNGSRELRVAQVNSDFKSFQYPSGLQQLLTQLPPLEVPFGKIVASEGLTPYLFQKIGTLATQYPLVSFGSSMQTPVGFVLGEGLWKWRIHTYLYNKNHLLFDEMFRSWIQYLANKNQDNLLRITAKKKWSVNENINFQAQLLDASLQPFPNQDITLKVIDESNKSLEYHFVPKDNQYYLSLGKLSPGAYRYQTADKNRTKDYKQEGSFTIEDIQLEYLQTTAQHAALRQISERTGGKFYSPSSIDQCINDLEEQKNLVSVSYDESTREEWIDLWPLYILLIALFSTEWFMRKRMGGY